MYADRLPLIQQLEIARGSKILMFVTGDRPNMEIIIAQDAYDPFVRHLDGLVADREGEKLDCISLYLHTKGGQTLVGWSLVNLLRRYCKALEVIVPYKALSTGTIMCLGADHIVMTKQAMLGPIDPSLAGMPLGPAIPGAAPQARANVSVEEIQGYIDLAKATLGKDADLSTVLLKLTDHVHPLVLGAVFRSRSQIQMLATKLLGHQVRDKEKVKKIVSFLCSDSGSHDYTIHRNEAQEQLGLAIKTPDMPTYRIIKAIYDDIAKELMLHQAYDPDSLLGQQSTHPYTQVRGLIESTTMGSHAFVSRGILARVQHPQTGQPAVQDTRLFDGWTTHAQPQPSPTPSSASGAGG